MQNCLQNQEKIAELYTSRPKRKSCEESISIYVKTTENYKHQEITQILTTCVKTSHLSNDSSEFEVQN